MDSGERGIIPVGMAIINPVRKSEDRTNDLLISSLDYHRRSHTGTCVKGNGAHILNEISNFRRV